MFAVSGPPLHSLLTIPYSTANPLNINDSSTEIKYRYESPWEVYAANWSNRTSSDHKFRLAVGSCIGNPDNKVHIVQLDKEIGRFRDVASFQHSFPTTKIMWIPDTMGLCPDLLATSGDCLRIWRLTAESGGDGASRTSVRMECFLSSAEGCSGAAKQLSMPLSSFDWNDSDPSLLATASIDSTCTIWALDTGQMIGQCTSNAGGGYDGKTLDGTLKTQCVAHDKEVYDVAFSGAGGGRDVFASVGAEGSLRMFDLRQLVHCTILYEDPQHQPLVRLAWNKQQIHLLATLAAESNEVIILDIRKFNEPLVTLKGRAGCFNGISWAPHSNHHIATAGDDNLASIWDIQQPSVNGFRAGMPVAVEEPILSYKALSPITQIQWSTTQPEWIAICYDNILEILKW